MDIHWTSRNDRPNHRRSGQNSSTRICFAISREIFQASTSSNRIQIVRCSKPRRSLEQKINETSDSCPQRCKKNYFIKQLGYMTHPPQTPPSHQPVLIIGKDISKLSFHKNPLGGIKLRHLWSHYALRSFDFFFAVTKNTQGFFKGHLPFHMATRFGGWPIVGQNHVLILHSLETFSVAKISRSDEEIRCRVSVTKFAGHWRESAHAYQFFSL